MTKFEHYQRKKFLKKSKQQMKSQNTTTDTVMTMLTWTSDDNAHIDFWSRYKLMVRVS